MARTGQPVPTNTYQQGRAKVSDGKSVKVAVPANSDIKAGELVLLGGFLGFAMRDVKTGTGQTAEVTLNIEQAEYETDKTTEGEAVKAGDLVYWDDTTKKLTLDDGEGVNRLAGRVTEGVDDNGVIWFILAPQM